MSKDEDSDFQPTTLQNNVVKHTWSGRRGKVKLHVRREGGREGGREREGREGARKDRGWWQDRRGRDAGREG